MRFGIMGNMVKDILWSVTENLVLKLQQRKVEYILHDDLAKWINKERRKKLIETAQTSKLDKLPEKCDILVSFGGDGTILRTARLVGDRGTPILGVNLGKLGFLAEFAVEEMDQWIDAVLENNYLIEDRMVLEAFANRRKNKKFFGLNDIVIDKSGSSRVIDLETYVDDQYLVTYTGDGLIITTPTGSTAYSLATGGPIVIPRSRAVAINPICPHTLTARPVIVPDESVICVRVNSEAKFVHIAADGQLEEILKPPVEFTIRRADYTIKLIKRKDRSYFDVLRAKLMWGKDIRVSISRESQ